MQTHFVALGALVLSAASIASLIYVVSTVRRPNGAETAAAPFEACRAREIRKYDASTRDAGGRHLRLSSCKAAIDQYLLAHSCSEENGLEQVDGIWRGSAVCSGRHVVFAIDRAGTIGIEQSLTN